MFFLNKIFRRYSFKDIAITIIKYIIGYPVLALSYIVPRDKSKWVFGNKLGFTDNGKYLYIYMLENTGEKAIWISSDRKLVRSLRRLGLPSYYKYSYLGLYHLLTAYYYVCTIVTRHICYWTSGGSYKVNLWHGVGLKAMGNGAGDLKDFSFLSKIMMPYAYEKYNIFLTSSKMNAKLISEAFKLSPDVVYDGLYPRCSFIMQDKGYVESFVGKYESDYTKEIIVKSKSYQRVYIYMPTWRLKYGSEFLKFALPDLKVLNESLESNNSLLLLKLHPSMKYNNNNMGQLGNIIYLSPEMDVYPILPFSDVLITDYSSIYYDYLLMKGKGCIVYDFDYEDYIKEEYNFYYDFNTYTPGRHCKDFDDLLWLISNNEDCSVDKREWILELMWGDYLHKDNQQLIDKCHEK